MHMRRVCRRPVPAGHLVRVRGDLMGFTSSGGEVMNALFVLILSAGLLPGALVDAEGDLRKAIYQEVALGETEGALAAYRAILGDEPAAKEVRAQALHRIAVCLAKLDRPEEAEEVLGALQEGFPEEGDLLGRAKTEVGRHGPETVGRFGRPRMEELILRLGAGEKEKAQEAGRMLKVLAPESIPHLKRALEHPDWSLRLRSAEVLWKMDDVSGFDPLERDLVEKGGGGRLVWSTVRGTVASMIKERADLRARVLERLAAATSPAEKGALFGVLAYADIKEPRVVAAAMELLDEDRWRRSARDFLIRKAPPGDALRGAMAAVEKGKGGEPQSIIGGFMDRMRLESGFRPEGRDELLLRGLSHSDPQARLHVMGSLQKWIGGRKDRGWPGGLSAENTLAAIERLLESSEREVLQEGGRALSKLIEISAEEGWLDEIRDRCLGFYVRMIRAGRSGLRQKAVSRLFAGAGEANPKVTNMILRHALVDRAGSGAVEWAERLGMENPALLADTLRGLLDGEKEPGQLLQSIRTFGGAERLALLEKFLERWPGHERNVAYVLGSLRDPAAVPFLRKLMREGDRSTRLAAVQSLGSYGAIDAVPDIIPLLTDLDGDVREKARGALEEIRRLDEEKDEWWAWYRARKKAEKEN